MTQPQLGESVLSRTDSAANHGATAPDRTQIHAQTRSGMLKMIAAAGIALGALTQGCGGEDDAAVPRDGITTTDSGMDPCDNKCGTNTHCNETTKHCDPNPVVDPCNNVCGTDTFCDTATGKCEPVPVNTFAGVTWKNTNAGSGNGWVDVLSGTDGDYPLGSTVWFTKGETPATVCFVGFGSGTIFTINGSGEWWNIEKPFLAGQTGHSIDDNAYFTSKQAAKDSAGQLLSYRTTPQAYRPANAFVWRAAGSNQSWVDSEAVGSGQSAIHCANVPNDGVVENH